MEHAICTERDQALLCLIVGEANALPAEGRGHISRRAVMTALCYSKIAGVPVDRRFLIYPPGPIADEILTDLEALEMDEALKNVSIDPQNHADYVSGIGALSLCARHRTWLEQQRPAVKKVVGALSPLTKPRLAQIACLHFLFLFLRKEAEGGLRSRTLAEFLAAAPGEGWTISKAEADALYTALVEARLIHD